MSDWRPIKTAPKDGKDVLVHRTDEDGGEWYAVACWWVGSWVFLGAQGPDPVLLDFEPTLWMPLPPGEQVRTNQG